MWRTGVALAINGGDTHPAHERAYMLATGFETLQPEHVAGSPSTQKTSAESAASAICRQLRCSTALSSDRARESRGAPARRDKPRQKPTRAASARSDVPLHPKQPIPC